MEASREFLDDKRNSIDYRLRKVPVNSKQDPLFKDLPQLFSALLEIVGVRIDTSAFQNLPIVTSVIR
jgi:hypothetical protein